MIALLLIAHTLKMQAYGANQVRSLYTNPLPHEVCS